jgi:hypothetical protein
MPLDPVASKKTRAGTVRSAAVDAAKQTPVKQLQQGITGPAGDWGRVGRAFLSRRQEALVVCLIDSTALQASPLAARIAISRLLKLAAAGHT